MCGFYGETSRINRSEEARLIEQLKFRGRDEINSIEKNDLYFLHSRLAITGTAFPSSQPISTKDGRYTLVFNGEIYSIYGDDSNQIEKFGDTIALINTLETFGVEETLLRLNGMFALAIFDAEENRLVLATDFFGQKPLYYRRTECGGLVFGSTGRLVAKENLDISILGLKSFLTYGFVLPGKTIYNGVERLTPGSFIEYLIARDELFVRNNFQQSNYYLKEDSKLSLKEAISEAIKDHSYSDFDVALALSGGVDSTLVYGLMPSSVREKVNTFTIDDMNPEELSNANLATSYFGSKTEALTIDKDVKLRDLKSIVACLDEPNSDSAIISSSKIFNLARKHSKVIILGDGGDELFQGYNRHRLWNKLVKIAPFFALFRYISRCLTPFARIILNKLPNNKLAQKVRILLNSLNSLYDVNSFCMSSLAIDLIDPIRGEKPKVRYINDVDKINYLPGNNLYRVDRISLNNDIEARAPLLDLRVAKIAIETDFNIPINQDKNILRKLRDEVYAGVNFDAKKMGFNVDIASLIKTNEASAYVDKGRELALKFGLTIPRRVSERRAFNFMILGIWLELNEC
jgi:asparagine synthase (glutamine-hydrolysing)